MNKKALIVVDYQYDFLPNGALAVTNGDRIQKNIEALIKWGNYDLIVFTQDFHPKGHVSFASTHKQPLFSMYTLPSGEDQVMWPDHCVQGTRGAEIALDNAYLDQGVIVQKGTQLDVDSYSGVFDNDHKTQTGLVSILKQRGITQTDCCGLATDYCVKATAIDLAKYKEKDRNLFSVNFITDAAMGVGIKPTDISEAVGEMKAVNVGMLKTRTILTATDSPCI